MSRIKIPFRVNEQGVRGVAAQVFLISVVTILTKSAIPVTILIIDFFVRAFFIPQYSILALISRKIVAPLLGFKKRVITFKPKRFAAGIGMIMAITAFVLLLKGLIIPAIIALSILALFSFLEAVFRFCAGCKIFSLLIKLRVIPEEECKDCVLGFGDGI